MYNYLISELQPNDICETIGVCGDQAAVPIAPLVPKELAVKVMSGQLIGAEESKINSAKVGAFGTLCCEKRLRVVRFNGVLILVLRQSVIHEITS